MDTAQQHGGLGMIMFVMYLVVCRVVVRETLKGVASYKVFGVCWAIGVVVFGAFMQLAGGDPWAPWILAALFMAPLAALMAMALSGR